MNKYQYTGLQRAKIISSQIFGFLGIVFFSGFGVFTLTLIGVVQVDASEPFLNNPKITVACLGIWPILLAWTIGSAMINLLPTIWVDNEGLYLSAFVVLKIKIRWTDIVDIGKGRPPAGSILVRARRITPFHRIIGWYYSRSLLPAFLINKEILHKDILVRKIEEHLTG